MAPPKKRTSSTAKRSKPSGKKSTVSKRTASKKRVKRTRTKKKGSKRGLLWGVILFLMAAMVGVGYCLGTCWLKEEKTTVTKLHPKAEKKPKKHIVKKEHAKSKPKPAAKSKVAKEKAKLAMIQQSRYKRSKLAYRGEKPRLAIIIDDVHTSRQLHTIQQLPVPVTPSIFPPYSLDRNTPRLATQAVHYMIHLPMESGNAKFDRQSKTVMRSFTAAQMQARMRELRRLFPRAHYINNHTGSLFTTDRAAMNRLYEAMKQTGFTFIDSRTSGKSQAGLVAHAFGDDYVARDIFLDNVKSVGAIHMQLKKAVRLAKKNGYAIAIGHPYKETMQALKQAKPLLKEVKVVYIDEIFREE
ncbi:MAG: divergent polysaccharide deacetylase family protein [Sulfurovum sp.]|nr:divergent polysaccharide deacetylase family protein [Sulfurovum sp.]